MVVYISMKIDENIKKRLDKLKVHPRETYSQIIGRLIEFFKENEKENRA